MALFNSLPSDLLPRLFAKARSRNLIKGQELFAEGEPGQECYRVRRGTLKISVVSQGGLERIFSIVSVGSVIGELSLLDGRPRSATVTALTDCELASITRSEFYRFASEVPQIYEHLTRLLASLVRENDASIAVSSFMSREGRLAWALLKLGSEFGAKEAGSERIVIRQKLNQAAIGSLANVSRENASRILNKWARLGVLSRVDGFYAITNLHKLENVASSSY